MDLIGKWKIAKSIFMDPETMEQSWLTPEELVARGEGDDIEQMLSCTFIFTPEGELLTAMSLPEGTPEEEIAAAVEAGEIELYGDDMAVFEKKRWKEENGKYYFDTGIEGEALGEKTDPWCEITEADGYLQLFTFLLEKAD